MESIFLQWLYRYYTSFNISEIFFGKGEVHCRVIDLVYGQCRKMVEKGYLLAKAYDVIHGLFYCNCALITVVC